ncbi:phosphatidylethanolamine-binding protein-like protein [Stipitochalara longipes BDJ]|nr:phosphatidylethanolamine-binding protein-like protein [Stipitochalara longipes BDJ]
MPVNNSVKRSLETIEKDTSKVLGLKVGGKDVTPGTYIPKAEAQVPPEITFNVTSPSSTYIAIGLDIDAPFPAFGPLGPILHWIQPGLKATPSASGASTLESSDPFVADYIGPAPPPFGGPHRYIFFLYDQPADFDGKKYAPPDGKSLSNWLRMRFDLDDFEKKAKLGPVLAVNYFKSN